MIPMHSVKATSLENYPNIRTPSADDALTAEDPALLLMTDFSKTEPLTLLGDASLETAQRSMYERRVRSALIVDSNGHFQGLLTLADLNSHRVLALATARGQSRQDLDACDVMTPRANLCGVTLQTLRKSRIGDCLKTMEHDGRQHLLVVDPLTQDICGMVSASDIARVLHNPVNIPRLAESFVDVVTALHD